MLPPRVRNARCGTVCCGHLALGDRVPSEVPCTGSVVADLRGAKPGSSISQRRVSAWLQSFRRWSPAAVVPASRPKTAPLISPEPPG